MIHLAILDAPEVPGGAIAARLRGAVLSDTQDADVVLCVNARRTSTLSEAGKRVLLVLDDTLFGDTLDPRVELVNPDRYLPSVRLIRQQLDAGKLGEPGLLRIHRWAPAGQLVRDLDLALWLFGKAPNAMHIVKNAACMQVHLGFTGGGMALIDHATALPEGDRYYSLSLIAACGAAYADDHANAQLLYQGGTARALRADEEIARWTALVQDIVGTATGSESYPTWADVRAVYHALTSAQ